MQKFDIVVVGAGPSGTIFSYLAAKAGFKILLIDKERFPRNKVCAGALSLRTLRMLDELNISSQVKKLKVYPITSFILYFKERKVVFDFSRIKESFNSYSAYALVVRRAQFDNLLFQLASQSLNVNVFEKAEAIDFKRINSLWEIKIKRAESGKLFTVRASLVVGSDGVNSIVLRRLAPNLFKERQLGFTESIYLKNIEVEPSTLEIHFLGSRSKRPVYFWIIPQNKFLINAGVGYILNSSFRDTSFSGGLLRLLKKDTRLKKRFEKAVFLSRPRYGFLPVQGRVHREVSGSGYILLGDAASLVDPFTGEGIGNAILSAQTAAYVVAKEKDFSEAKLSKYRVRLSYLLDKELRTAYLFSRITGEDFLREAIGGKVLSLKIIRGIFKRILISRRGISGIFNYRFLKKRFFYPV